MTNLLIQLCKMLIQMIQYLVM